MNGIINIWLSGRFAPLWIIWFLLVVVTSFIAFVMVLGNHSSTVVADSVSCHVMGLDTYDSNSRAGIYVDCGHGKTFYRNTKFALEVAAANPSIVVCQLYADDSVGRCKKE